MPKPIQILAIAFLAFNFAPLANAASSITWEVVDRFRLLDKPEDFPKLMVQVRTAPERAAQGKSGTFPSPLTKLAVDHGTYALPANAWLPTEQRYREGYAAAASFALRTSLQGSNSASQCEWRVTSTNKSAIGPCKEMYIDQVSANDEIAASVIGGGFSVSKASIQIEHRRIVVMGDSFASGEGVPDINREWHVKVPDGDDEYQGLPYWWDQKCHRSLLSAGVRSAMEWVAGATNRSSTVLSYACSGAEIGGLAETSHEHGGILSVYVGRETKADLNTRKHEGAGTFKYDLNIQTSDIQPIHSQLNQAIRDLCRGQLDTTRPIWACGGQFDSPDLLILSIGGNDVGFGEIIKRAVLGGCDSACIAEVSGKGMAALPAKYAEMAQLLNQHLGAKRSLLLDYGNPTKNENKKYCSDDRNPLSAKNAGTFIFQVNQNAYRDAHLMVVGPLNKIGNDFVKNEQTNGWARLAVMENASDAKGVCSKSSWFNGSWAAWSKQYKLPNKPYSSGVMHPNVIYHARQAAFIVDWMNRTKF